MTSKSPTPWTLDLDKVGPEFTDWPIRDANGNPVVQTDSGCYPPDNETAAMIVEAVNEHAMASRNFRIELDIKDSEGDARYDYTEEYLVSSDVKPDGFEDAVKEFKNRVKAAISDLVTVDPDLAEYIVCNYGYASGINLDDPEDFLPYILNNFPLRGVVQIPSEILLKHGIKAVAPPEYQLVSYDDSLIFEEDDECSGEG